MKKRLLQVIFSLIGIGLIVKITGNIFRLIKAGEQIKLAEERVLKLEKEKKELLEKYQYYQSPEFVEEEARNKLNMARPGETIVILPPNASKFSSPPPKENLPNWKKWWQLFF